MVAQESLELFVMVRIHAGQPALLSTLLERANKRLLTKAEGEAWFAVVPAQPGNVIPLPAVSRRDAH